MGRFDAFFDLGRYTATESQGRNRLHAGNFQVVRVGVGGLWRPFFLVGRHLIVRRAVGVILERGDDGIERVGPRWRGGFVALL